MNEPRDALERLRKGDRDLARHILEIGTECLTEASYATVVYRTAFKGNEPNARAAAMRIMRFLVEVGYVELWWEDRDRARELGAVRGATPVEPGEVSAALAMERKFEIRATPPEGERGRRLMYGAIGDGKRD